MSWTAAIAAWTRRHGRSTRSSRSYHDQEVPVSPINSIADIVSDPQFHERGVIVEVEDERLDRPLLVPGVVPKLSRTPGGGARARTAPGRGV